MTDTVRGGSKDTTPVEPPVLRAIPVRHWGRWIAGAIVLVLVGLFLTAAAQASIHWSTIPAYLTADVILRGLRMTIVISVVAQAFGVALGVVFAVMRLSKNPVVSSVAWFYIWFFRGTPVYVQLIIWFNLSLVFPTLTIPGVYSTPMNQFMTPFMAALLGLGLNEGAYMAEIVRAGVISVDEGQSEAAHALGMTGAMTMRRVVLPQAMRVIVPPSGNEFINMLKTSSLASVVLLDELLRSAQSVYSRTLQTIEMLLTVSIWYLVLTSVFSIAQFYVERRFARGSARALAETPIRRLLRNLQTGPRLR